MFGLFENMKAYNAANQFAKDFFGLDVLYASETPMHDKHGKYVMYLRPELVNVMDCEIVESVEYEETEYDN
jgi:hypothetical protein